MLHLLWTGRLRADLRRPLGAGTPVRLAAGACVMSGQVLSLAPGSRLSFDGDVVEVVAVDGVRVTVRNDRTRRFTAVQISRLAASARPAGGPSAGDAGVPPGLALAA